MAHSLSDRSLPALQVSPPHARTRTHKLPAWPLFSSLTAITAVITTTITGYCKRATTRRTTTSWSSPGSSSMVSCTSRAYYYTHFVMEKSVRARSQGTSARLAWDLTVRSSTRVGNGCANVSPSSGKASSPTTTLGWCYVSFAVIFVTSSLRPTQPRTGLHLQKKKRNTSNIVETRG